MYFFHSHLLQRLFLLSLFAFAHLSWCREIALQLTRNTTYCSWLALPRYPSQRAVTTTTALQYFFLCLAHHHAQSVISTRAAQKKRLLGKYPVLHPAHSTVAFQPLRLLGIAQSSTSHR